MIKKLSVIFILAILVLVGCEDKEAANGSGDEVITLKVADAFPTTHPVSTEGAVFFMDRVEELTDGKVKFDYYPAEQLGSATSLLDLAQSKTTDIAYVGAGYVTDRLPLSGVAQLPGLYQTALEGSLAYWELINDRLLDEELLKNGVRPVFAIATPPYQLTTTNKKVETLEDFKGIKVRTTGGIQDITANAVGLTPVPMPGGELYTSLDRKTIDGALLAYSSWKAYQLEEIIKHATTNVNLGSAALLYVINEEVYQDLPADVQEALITAGEETIKHLATLADKQSDSLSKEFADKGIDIYQISDEELKRINQELSAVWDEWSKPLVEKGLPAEEVIQDYLKIIENQ